MNFIVGMLCGFNVAVWGLCLVCELGGFRFMKAK